MAGAGLAGELDKQIRLKGSLGGWWRAHEAHHAHHAPSHAPSLFQVLTKIGAGGFLCLQGLGGILCIVIRALALAWAH